MTYDHSRSESRTGLLALSAIVLLGLPVLAAEPPVPALTSAPPTSPDAVAQEEGIAPSSPPPASPTASTKAPWKPAEPPAPPGDFLYGDGYSYFYGLTPGVASQTSGLGSGGTGVTNLGGEFQAGFSGFTGASWYQYSVDPEDTIRLQASGRLTLAADVNKLSEPGQTHTGYSLALSAENASGEYLHYVSNIESVPVFIGAWGEVPQLSFATGVASQPSAERETAVKLPLSLSVGGGIGRVYPLGARIVLKRVEAVLLADHTISGAIPDKVGRKILGQWYAHRNDLRVPPDANNPYGSSYHRLLLSALQILKDEGLLVKPVHVLDAYRLERVLVDPNTLDRWVGWEVRAGIRSASQFSRTWPEPANGNPDTPTAWAIEARGRFYYNLTLDSDLRFDPGAAVALREKDEAGNTLQGARRVSLAAPPSAVPAGTTNADVLIPSGRVVLDLPVTYVRYVYDSSYNLAGAWNLFLSASAGRTGGIMALGAATGVAYTFFSDSRTGYTLGCTGGLGYQDSLLYRFSVIAVIGLGTGESFYVAPDQVGDTVPFESSWLPGMDLGGAL